MKKRSKLPHVGTTIFSVMSALAREHRAINLSQGFPNFDCSAELRQLVNEAMLAGHNQYAPMPGLPALREAIAVKAAKTHGIKIHADDEITITAGATQAIFTAISAIVHAGDEVILFEPAYDCYRPAIELHGGIAKTHKLTGPDFRINWNAVEQLIKPQTRLIIVNTPHNPTGRCLSQADWEALEALCARHDILILSDEVYEHVVFDHKAHESILRRPALRSRAFATFSFGKTFHTTGWKMGYIIAPPDLTREFRKVHQFNVFSVNTPMQHALAAFLQDESNYQGLNHFFQTKRDRFLSWLEKSRFTPYHTEGSYFQIVDYSTISRDDDVHFARHMTMHHGVAAIPVSAFRASPVNEHLIRFCFAKTEETLDRAGELLYRI